MDKISLYGKAAQEHGRSATAFAFATGGFTVAIIAVLLDWWALYWAFTVPAVCCLVVGFVFAWRAHIIDKQLGTHHHFFKKADWEG